VDNDVNSLFNPFSNNYLQIFYTTFPTAVISKVKSNNNKKNWITNKLRTQCYIKRDLYLLTRNSNNMDLLNYYKIYTKVLS
jgi:hypothetical protein